MKLKLTLTLLSSFLLTTAWAQDPVFTQFSLVPETLNPGFTGYLDTWHAGALHRSQWPNGDKKIETNYAFVNKSISDKVSLGLTILNQREVFTTYNYLQINGAFAYKIELNEDWSIRPALEGGYGSKSFNFSNLLLEDQININTGAVNSGSVDPSILNRNDNINFFDLSAGFVMDKEGVWFGAALKHLTRPNISFTANGQVPLDLFLTVHGGYAFDIYSAQTRSFIPVGTKLLLTGNYMRQAQYNRFDVGAFLQFQTFTFGATTVTNLEGKSSNSHLLTSINPSASVQFGKYFVFGYSYDISTSRLGNTQGVHELSLTWQFEFIHKCMGCPNYNVD
jgi:type IX secretion system PorP/SprF family membrane protein